MLPNRSWALPSGCSALVLLVSVAWPTVVRGGPFPADPVEAFHQALIQDRAADSPEAQDARRKNLMAAAANLRTLGDLSRVLMLVDWNYSVAVGGGDADIDNQVRRQLMDRFEQGVKRFLAGGSPMEQVAVANLIAQTVGAARRQESERQSDGGSQPGKVSKDLRPAPSFRFLRQRVRLLSADLERLTQSPVPEVRAAAARALGSIEAEPKATAAILRRLLADRETVVRRAAADALGTMVTVATQVGGAMGSAEPLDTVDDKSPGEPLRTAAAVVPVGCSALSDADAETRRLAVAALRKVSTALTKMVLPLSDTLPPQGRKLAAAEAETVRTEKARVTAFQQSLQPVLDAFRDHTAALTRAAADPDATVRIDVRRVLEDLAQVAQKMLRQREVFTYPNVKPPENLPGPGRPGASGAGAAASPWQAASAFVEGPPAFGSAVEAHSPIPAPALTPASDAAALGAPERLSPAENAAVAGRAVVARPASFVKAPGDELPPPKRLGPEGAAEATLDRSMAALLTGLSDPVPRVRLATIDVLEEMGPSAAPAAPALVRALSDRSRFVRWAAARTLGRMAPADARAAVPALAGLINPWEDLSVRLAAITTLGQYGPDAKAAVPVLASAVNKSDVDLRLAALKALEAVGTDAAPAVPAIAGGLQDSSPQVRAESARVLGRFGPLAAGALPALNNALNDPSEDIRRNASEAILAIERH